MSVPKINPIADFIASRQKIALNRAAKNPEYKEICIRQYKNESKIKDLLENNLEKDDCIFVLKYYADELSKMVYLDNEIYLQGIRDAVNLFVFLNNPNKGIGFLK